MGREHWTLIIPHQRLWVDPLVTLPCMTPDCSSYSAGITSIFSRSDVAEARLGNSSSKSSPGAGRESGGSVLEKGLETNEPTPEYVVLDCSFVAGLDGNAVDGLLKLQAIHLYLWCNLPSR